MNRRNWEVFGPSKKTKAIIIGIVALVVLVLAAWLFMQNESPTAATINQPSNQLTGAIVEQQQEQQQRTIEEQQQEEIQQEERQYFSYKGQCAFDMKQRQDDLVETKNGADGYQEEITKLTEEYEARKKELEEQYTVPITNLKVKLEKAQKEFSDAQQRHDITKATCDAQQPT